MKTQIKKMKVELKALAQEIKTNKPAYRKAVSAYDKSSVEQTGYKGTKYMGKDPALSTIAYNLKSTVGSAQHHFRHKHIAYCLLRGRTMEQIESKGDRCAPDKKYHYGCNCPDMKYVERIMKEVQDEALRDSENGPVEIPASSASGTCPSPVATEQSQPDQVVERDIGVSEDSKPGLLTSVLQLFR